jgi:protein phosphatase
MNWKTAPPVSFSETGRRKSNQDCLYPLPDDASSVPGLFMVCDGMGGASNGEVASKLVCDSLAKWFAENPLQSVNEHIMKEAFVFMRQQFDEYTQFHPNALDMGSTLVLAKFYETGCAVAHCGDSRLYHFRNGSCLFKTFDHTPVNDLIRNGIISPEEALEQPRSSIISRAVQGSPHKFCLADVSQLTDIEVGDFIVLCSDGVWSCISTQDFAQLFAADGLLAEKMDTLKKLCEARSRDNYTAMVIPIVAV